MINLAKINSKSFAGKAVRWPLRLIPSSMTVRIMQGGNKGYKWVVGSGVHGYWLGTYEIEKQLLIMNYCKTAQIAYDIGAHVGFYTLLFSRLVGSYGRVYCFEPDLRNLYYLKRHLLMNRISNVCVFPIAVGNQTGYRYFCESQSSSMGHLSEKCENSIVISDRIDRLVYEYRLVKPPDIMKIDVEGAEFEVLKGMMETVKRCKPIIFIAFHTSENKKLICQLLSELRFKIEVIGDMPDEIVAIPL